MITTSRLKCAAWLVSASIFCALGPRPTFSQQVREPDRKAIVIGINCYDPDDPGRPECAALKRTPADNSAMRFGTVTGNWTYWRYRNLNGAVNDATMMKAILEGQNFVVPDSAFLIDEKATGSAILNALRKYLTVDVQPGDIRFIYYSGHGNYVRNLAVTNPNDVDAVDETIVPSDHWRNTPDIRDKELSRIFTEAVTVKKVKIIFVADSCHSGSISRGPGGMAKTANNAGSAEDPMAPRVTDKAPADNSRIGLITISAARRDQVALETEGTDVDILDKERGPHGAFTWALRKAWLGQRDASLDRLFQKASAMLALDKPNQVPNIDGLHTNEITLFGDPTSASSERAAVVQSVAGNEIRLRGGRAAGIYAGTELKRVSSNTPVLRVRVTDDQGLDFSVAHIIEGSGTVKTGDSFQVDKLVLPAESMISLYIPPPISADGLSRALSQFAALGSRLGSNWVVDEAAVTPTHFLRWNGKDWLLEKGDFEEGGTDLGAAPTADAIARQLPDGAKLFVALPPPQDLVALFPFGKDDKGRVTIAKSSGGANYRLRGRIHDGAAEYSWMQPTINTTVVKAAAQKNALELPVGTDWMGTGKADTLRDTASDLAEKGYRLGRLREWQTLIAFGSSSKPFPYHLEFREAGSGKPVTTNTVTGGKKYKMFLKSTEGEINAAGAVVPHYTYIFAIDQYGKGTLLWPSLGQGNQDNLFPRPVPEGEAKRPTPTEIAVSGTREDDFEIAEPYGNDTYLLLTSVQRISNPDIFDFEGVRTKAPQTRGVSDNPLEALLSGIGTTTRAPRPSVPTDWSVQTVILHSEAP